MDFVRAYSSFLAILAVVVLLCFDFDIKHIDFSEMSLFESIMIKGFGIIIAASPIIIYHWEQIRLAYIIRKNNLSGFIIEKQEILLDIRDEGRFATYFHKIYFHQFNRKSKDQYISKMNVSGTIDRTKIQTLNCYYSVAREGNYLEVSYVNGVKKLTGIKSFFKRNDKFLFFYAELKDTFIDLEESWTMDVMNLCQDYNLQILMPPGKTVNKINFSKLMKSEGTEKEVTVEGIRPLLIQEGDRQKIILQVMNVDKDDHYKIKWLLNG